MLKLFQLNLAWYCFVDPNPTLLFWVLKIRDINGFFTDIGVTYSTPGKAYLISCHHMMSPFYQHYQCRNFHFEALFHAIYLCWYMDFNKIKHQYCRIVREKNESISHYIIFILFYLIGSSTIIAWSSLSNETFTSCLGFSHLMDYL